MICTTITVGKRDAMKRGLDICPNCTAIWGVDEIQFGECDRCNYPNHTFDYDDEFMDVFIAKEATLTKSDRDELDKEFHEDM